MQTELTYTVAAVARRLGVAAATLRTWDRRYGLGPSEHSAGSHRRYNIQDLSRLETMRRMVMAGVPACDAARLAITATAAQLPAVLEESVVETFASRLPTSDATALVRGLTRAADALDSLACSHILQTHIDKHGVEWTWNNVLTPVMIDLGRRWEINESDVEIEHLLSECALGVFSNVANKLTQAINVRPVLLACSPDDLHSLPIAALSAALATRGIASRNLGARVPHDSLVSAMNKLGPSCVMVWAQTDGCCDTARLAGLPHRRPQARIFAAGPGWSDPMPEGVTRIHSFSEGLELLAAAAI